MAAAPDVNCERGFRLRRQCSHLSATAHEYRGFFGSQQITVGSIHCLKTPTVAASRPMYSAELRATNCMNLASQSEHIFLRMRTRLIHCAVRLRPLWSDVIR